MRNISANVESLAVIVNIEAQNIKNEAKRQIFPRGAEIGIGRQCNSLYYSVRYKISTVFKGIFPVGARRNRY